MRASLTAGIALAVSLLLNVAPVQAQWTPNQRNAFTHSCVEGCETTPGLKPEMRSLCRPACGCMLDEGQKFISSAEFAEMEKAQAAGRPHPKTRQLDSYNQICIRRAMGR